MSQPNSLLLQPELRDMVTKILSFIDNPSPMRITCKFMQSPCFFFLVRREEEDMPPKKNNKKKGDSGGSGGMTKKEYQAKRKQELAEEAAKEKSRKEDAQENRFYHNVTTAGIPAGKRFVGLHHSITTGQSTKRCFYPGAPKWMDISNFYEMIQHEWRPVAGTPSEERFEKEVSEAKKHRRFVRLIESAYAETGGEHKKLTVREHKQIFHNCAAVLNWDAPDDEEWSRKEAFSDEEGRVSKDAFSVEYAEHEPTQKMTWTPMCCRCKELLKDSDPPECICGATYCSDACHEADWGKHEKRCLQQSLALNITQFYWQRVFVGALPCKDEPDFVDQWRAKGINDVEQEMLFYFHNDRASCVEHIQRFGEGLDELSRRAPGAEQSFVRLMDKVYCLKMHYITPLYDDSPTRLQFKLKMADDFYTLQKQFPRESGIDFALPNRATLTREFTALIEERKKWVNGRRPVPVALPTQTQEMTADVTLTPTQSPTLTAGGNPDDNEEEWAHDIPPCAHCGKVGAPVRCSRCKVGYCNRECQTADWKAHKKKCKKGEDGE